MSAGPFHRVLVGWDCSPSAAAALMAAAAVTDGQSGRVVALAVLRPVHHGESDEDWAAETAALRHQAEVSFRTARDRLPTASQARMTLDFAESPDAARALCDYADEHAFGLIALGRHGTGGFLHPRLGHVAETVAKKSTLPLLLLGSRGLGNRQAGQNKVWCC